MACPNHINLLRLLRLLRLLTYFFLFSSIYIEMPVKIPKKKIVKRKYVRKGVKSLQSLVQRAIRANNNKNLEVKTAITSASDGTEIAHNNFITLDSNLLETTQGVTASQNGVANRIGDKITLKKVNITMMVEMNERYSDVTYRILVVKMAKGDSLNSSTLYNGLSNNKMIDTINYERYSIIYQKFFKITARNQGTLQNMQGTNSGLYGVAASSAYQGAVLSRASRIIKISIPAKKIVRSGIVVYENGSSQPKFFDYKVLLYAYSNWSTSDSTLTGGPYNVGRLNDYVKVMSFTDS